MAMVHEFGGRSSSRLASVAETQVVCSGFVDAPVPGLDAVTREVFAQLGDEYPELCERLFAQDSDFRLA
jgi:hypothetical protein